MPRQAKPHGCTDCAGTLPPRKGCTAWHRGGRILVASKSESRCQRALTCMYRTPPSSHAFTGLPGTPFRRGTAREYQGNSLRPLCPNRPPRSGPCPPGMRKNHDWSATQPRVLEPNRTHSGHAPHHAVPQISSASCVKRTCLNCPLPLATEGSAVHTHLSCEPWPSHPSWVFITDPTRFTLGNKPFLTMGRRPRPRRHHYRQA
ncbi:hypothetical protein BC628DRAFT_935898 [Trametes gibbosa]|nr:hypothetical protein BC628DRAFT_935898 [Trametes gibbosa]